MFIRSTIFKNPLLFSLTHKRINFTVYKQFSDIPKKEEIKNIRLKDLLEITKFKLSLMNTSVSMMTFWLLHPQVFSPTLFSFALATQLMVNKVIIIKAMSSQTYN